MYAHKTIYICFILALKGFTKAKIYTILNTVQEWYKLQCFLTKLKHLKHLKHIYFSDKSKKLGGKSKHTWFLCSSSSCWSSFESCLRLPFRWLRKTPGGTRPHPSGWDTLWSRWCRSPSRTGSLCAAPKQRNPNIFPKAQVAFNRNGHIFWVSTQDTSNFKTENSKTNHCKTDTFGN